MPRREFNGVSEAHDFLRALGASERLIQHVILVAEAAELLIDKFAVLNVPVDDQFIRLGVAFHDAGKILHPEELNQSGKRHEPDGEAMLLEPFAIERRGKARPCPDFAPAK
jgi:hypothetical protein